MPMRSDSSHKPVLAAALGVAFFAGLDAGMKEIAGAYPLLQATGMRYWAGALAALIYYVAVGGRWPRLDQVRRSVPRAIANVCAGTCFFLALGRLPLMDVIALTFLSPLFLSLWGWLLLREAISPKTLAAILVGLLGVFIIAHGQSLGLDRRFDPLGLAGAIAAGALYSLSLAITRSHSSTDGVPTLVLLPSLIAALFYTAPMALAWREVALWHYAVLAAVGALGTAGLVCLAWAYSNSKVGRLGLLEYTALIWAAVFGFVFFAEAPSPWTLAGALLIIGACVPAFRSAG